ncbi:DUF1366 domain-containing protein [Streptococcus suis]|uniref:DUF1366 domain-containing protein n=1 Tax=Streptococcus suis TaxID=1307 RepID=UPI0005BA121C|nr:DUF1366 domain-containing protein [Streptococcus suis]CYY63321.1 Protein of uncharacterised function (DUF1366) [Streptococcus suis]CZA56645.1 Protein of uncharacterised function (DUF1366) [Streptococcus suis]
MKFEYGSKSQEYDASGTASATKVMLVNSDGASVPIFLPPDKIDLSNTELLELALEVIYQENFPMRAENEKFNEIGEKIAKYDELIEKSQKAIKDLEQATDEAKLGTVKNEQAVNRAVSELTELVMGVLASISPVEVVEEGAHEELTE